MFQPPARNITKEERKALEDIRRNQNLIVVRADKGNAIVVTDRQDYNMKIQTLLDTDHYKKLNKNPTTKPDPINLARLCLTSTYFLWNGEFYEQASGAAMGSPPSSIIANIFMEAFEYEAIEFSRMKPKCWYRYIDDTFVIWPHGPRTLEEFLLHINRQHANINFTMEIEEDDDLPFLDVPGERIATNWATVCIGRGLTQTGTCMQHLTAVLNRRDP
ncbi:hypothetical protein Trydic_g20555 [Trypoxylus dichotomus]